MLEKKLRQYLDRFGDTFPTMPLALNKTPEQIIAIVDDCLKNNKDVYELGYLDEDYSR